MNFVMDFWNIPAYAQLLTVSQTDFKRLRLSADRVQPNQPWMTLPLSMIPFWRQLGVIK